MNNDKYETITPTIKVTDIVAGDTFTTINYVGGSMSTLNKFLTKAKRASLVGTVKVIARVEKTTGVIFFLKVA